MLKTASPTFESSLLKGVQSCQFSNDQISELPDEILVSILSRLTVKEAARICTLGRRWENLWKFCTVLDLDDHKTLNNSLDREWKRQAYSRWVTRALKSHHAQNIQEFRVRFDLNYTNENDIDNWVHFAFQKRVQKLELDFSSWRGCNQGTYECYPLKMQPLGFGGFNRLSTLHMKEVNATDEVFEYLFASSPLLEELSIISSHKVVNLKILGPSHNLKYLEIELCSRLKSVEISALPLVSFKCSGNKICMLLKDVPQLAEVSFRGFYEKRLSHMADWLSSYLPQLKKLELDFTWEALTLPSFRFPEELPKLPELSNLSHLKLDVQVTNVVILARPVMLLLDVCPLLHRFTLKLRWSYGSIVREEPERIKKHPLPSLKVVELLDFVGDKADMEVAIYLLENAVSLEKLVISLNDLWRLRDSSEFAEEQQLTRECAMKLGANLPSGAEFILFEA